MYKQSSTNQPRQRSGDKIKSFRDLQVWKLGKEVSLDIYRETKDYPREETYGLSAQMRRASVSIASNIAEGFNSKHNNEYKQFLYISLGSCAELETQVEISAALQLISVDAKDDLIHKLNHESAMLRNLIKKL